MKILVSRYFKLYNLHPISLNMDTTHEHISVMQIQILFFVTVVTLRHYLGKYNLVTRSITMGNNNFQLSKMRELL